MRFTYTQRFIKASARLPQRVQDGLAKQLELLAASPTDPRLHVKRLNPPFTEVFSFRIGREHRALFSFTNERTIELLDVDHRKDIYR